MPPQGNEPSTIFLQRQPQGNFHMTKDSYSANCAHILLVCLRILHRHGIVNTPVTCTTSFNPRMRCRTTKGSVVSDYSLTVVYGYTKRAFFGILHTSLPMTFISSDKNTVAAKLIPTGTTNKPKFIFLVFCYPNEKHCKSNLQTFEDLHIHQLLPVTFHAIVFYRKIIYI
jgi:hypothetical protein